MVVFLDVEVAPNYFLLAYKRGGIYGEFEMYDGQQLDRDAVRRLMASSTTVSFNGLHYDLPIIMTAIRNTSTNLSIYEVSVKIIEQNLRSWQSVGNLNDKWKHIDLKEVAPGVMVSLKLYGGRMMSRNLQDLPFDPHEPLPLKSRGEVVSYCHNDLDTTEDLYNQLVPQLHLREQMSEQYGINLMSKSDAQIAEAVLIHEIEVASGTPVPRPHRDLKPSRYKCPEWLWFETQALRQLHSDVMGAEFGVDKNGRMIMPPTLDKRVIPIADGKFRLGIGGVHSSEKKVSYYADDDHLLIDVDVASYYPAIILGQGLYPPQCGEQFLKVYEKIVRERLHAKIMSAKIRLRIASLESESHEK